MSLREIHQAPKAVCPACVIMVATPSGLLALSNCSRSCLGNWVARIP